MSFLPDIFIGLLRHRGPWGAITTQVASRSFSSAHHQTLQCKWSLMQKNLRNSTNGNRYPCTDTQNPNSLFLARVTTLESRLPDSCLAASHPDAFSSAGPLDTTSSAQLFSSVCSAIGDIRSHLLCCGGLLLCLGGLQSCLLCCGGLLLCHWVLQLQLCHPWLPALLVSPYSIYVGFISFNWFNKVIVLFTRPSHSHLLHGLASMTISLSIVVFTS